MAEASGDAGSEPPEPTHRTAVLESVWRCLNCGELWLRRDPPRKACPNGGAPPEACLPVGRSSSWCRRTEGNSSLLAHELDDDLPFAAAVQLHQEQPLPLAQH